MSDNGAIRKNSDSIVHFDGDFALNPSITFLRLQRAGKDKIWF